MTGKPFKFRYASEMAGLFVLVSVLLVVAAIVFASHSQGWFERRFVLRAKFDTEEGAFGLQEGNEVRIRDTLAGHVGKIMPTADGCMETTFELKDRFKPFLTKDSVAKIKKKFGVAGDSFVAIEKGKGPQVANGDFIVCKKDEEIMEMAKKALSDVQAVVLPLLDETTQILSHVNGIVGSVEGGDGLAGALIKDKKLTDDIKGIVDNVNHLLGSVEGGDGLTGALIKDKKLTDDVKRTVNNVNYLLQDSQEAMYETTRLVKGIQNHWLIRPYMGRDKMAGYVAPRRFNDVELRRYSSRFRSDLKKARAANDSSEIARNAYNLAVCLLGQSKFDEIGLLLKEAQAETHDSVEGTIRNQMLEAEVVRQSGNTNRALEIVKSAVLSLDKSVSTDMRLECQLMEADISCDAGKGAEAKSELKAMAKLIRKTESPRLKAMAAGVTGRMLIGEGRPSEAGGQFDLEASLLQEAESYFEMASALEAAGNAYEQVGDHAAAADRYFRAGRSWLEAGYRERGDKALVEAFAPAQLCGNDYILDQIRYLTSEAAVAHAKAAP